MTTTTSSASLRTLGNSDLQLTPIGFGAWAVGGGNWEFAWGPQDDNESIAAIHRALDLGVNWIDTAAIYGLGHSEEVVARALKSTSHRPYVFTKCSMRWHEDRSIYRSLKAGSLAEELDGSLRRLGVETIDLYQVHWPNPEEEIEEGWAELERFRKQGKVRWIGVSNFNVDQMKRAQAVAPITSLQPPYSMLRRARLSRNLKLVELLREIGNGHGVAPGVVAVAWTLHNPAITAAIVGGRSAAQAAGLAPALSFRLTDEEYARINGFLAEPTA
jgi:aryl-alcohol dehydrogenase-like predicted oxidoreductase